MGILGYFGRLLVFTVLQRQMLGIFVQRLSVLLVTYSWALIRRFVHRGRVLLVLVCMVVRHLGEINRGRSHLWEYCFGLCAVDSCGLGVINL